MAKICVICGEDCSGRPRTKDPRGRYYCVGCYERAMQGRDQAHLPEAATPNKKSDGRGISLGSFVSPHIGLCLLGVVLTGVFILGDWFTFLFMLFIAVAVVNGYWIGASKIGALLGGLLAGAVVGVPLGKAIEGVYAGVLHTSGVINRMLSIGLTALVTFIITTVILKILINHLLKDRPAWTRYDRVAGAGLGLLEGALIACLAVWALLALEPIAAISLEQTGAVEDASGANPVSRWIVSVSGSARGSLAGRLADTANPLSETRFLTLLADSVVVINDPETRDAFINHPAMKRIESHPSVQEALQILKDDQALCDTLEAGDMGEVLKPTFPI